MGLILTGLPCPRMIRLTSGWDSSWLGFGFRGAGKRAKFPAWKSRRGLRTSQNPELFALGPWVEKNCCLYVLFPIFLELFLFPISESKFRGFLGNLAFHHRSSSLEKPVKIDQLLSWKTQNYQGRKAHLLKLKHCWTLAKTNLWNRY